MEIGQSNNSEFKILCTCIRESVPLFIIMIRWRISPTCDRGFLGSSCGQFVGDVSLEWVIHQPTMRWMKALTNDVLILVIPRSAKGGHVPANARALLFTEMQSRDGDA